MSTVLRYPVLVIDDEETIRRLLIKELSNKEREVSAATNAREALALVKRHWYDVIIMDLLLPDTRDLDLLIRLKDLIPHVEIIVITGHGDIETAVEAMKLGAYDFVRKPFNLERLDLMVDKAQQRVRLRRENIILRHNNAVREKVQFIGKSKGIQEVRYLVDKVAPATIPVLLTGESGTGKDVVARLIHESSHCSARPIIIKNCATLQKELVRSELFGHVKGAFTGSDKSRDGLLAYAHNSTLFLDEIGDLPMDVQASLLRALESQTYRRVGEKQERHVNIRFLFATNKNLAHEVAEKRFNEALYHRINAFHIPLPSLKKRKEDLPLLVDFFLTALSRENNMYTVTQGAMGAILSYDWPGNVRELRNVLERSVILAENTVITRRCLPKEISRDSTSRATVMTLAEVERQHIVNMLRFYANNRQKTAVALGIGRKTLYRKMKSYGM